MLTSQCQYPSNVTSGNASASSSTPHQQRTSETDIDFLISPHASSSVLSSSAGPSASPFSAIPPNVTVPTAGPGLSPPDLLEWVYPDLEERELVSQPLQLELIFQIHHFLCFGEKRVSNFADGRYRQHVRHPSTRQADQIL